MAKRKPTQPPKASSASSKRASTSPKSTKKSTSGTKRAKKEVVALKPDILESVPFDEFLQVRDLLKKARSTKARRVRGSLYDLYFRIVMTDIEYAIAFLRAYFPEWERSLDFERLTIKSETYVGEDFAKRIADVVYSIPCKAEGFPDWEIAIIFEHKAQSGFAVDKQSILNLMGYIFHDTERRHRSAPNEVTPQAVAAIVYTGADPNYDTPKWSQFFPTLPEMASMSFPDGIPCINLTKLYQEGKLKGPAPIKVMGEALARASLRILNKAYKTLFAPFQEVTKKDDNIDEKTQRFLALSAFFVDEANYSAYGEIMTDDNLEELYDGACGPGSNKEKLMTGFDIILSRERNLGREEERKRNKAKEKREQNLLFQGLSDRFGGSVRPALKRKIIAKMNERSGIEVFVLMTNSQSIEEFEQGLDELQVV